MRATFCNDFVPLLMTRQNFTRTRRDDINTDLVREVCNANTVKGRSWNTGHC